MSSTKIIMGSS